MWLIRIRSVMKSRNSPKLSTPGGLPTSTVGRAVRPAAEHAPVAVAALVVAIIAMVIAFGLFLPARRADTGADRAESAARSTGGAEHGAEVHHRLGVVAGALPRRQPCLLLADDRLRLGQRRLDRKQPGDNPFDIAVDHRRRFVEGDRRDRRRCVGADAGEGGE